jgi:hypothetical protein
VLDWVPQKAAQHIRSDATTRFMPILDLASAPPGA